MAATATTEPKPLETAGVFEDKGGATPLLGFSNLLGFNLPPARTSKDVLEERREAGERVAKTYERAAEEGEQAAAEVKRTAQQQQDERRAAKPTPPAIAPAPSQKPRMFLEPGESLLGQFQTIMVGIGNMALQGRGLMGGSAFAATAAMKGLAEGWQAGDAERVKREYAEWKANSDRLLEQHKLARQQWEDLLTDHKQGWDAILAQTRVRAEINGNKALAEAARTGNIDAVLKWYQHTEQLELEHTKFAAQMAHWHAQAEKEQRNYLATEAHRRETEARATEASKRGERRLKMQEDMNTNVLKLQGQDIALTQRIDNVARVRDAVELLAAEGILPAGATWWDKAQAGFALQSKPGRGDIANAVQTLQRLGTPLLVGTEISLGMQGQTMRLKAIGEAEAANIAGVPKSFWDDFLPKAEKNLTEQQKMVRSHLQAAGRVLPKGGEDFELLSTTDEAAR